MGVDGPARVGAMKWDKLACGHCGNDLVRLHRSGQDIRVLCDACGCVSHIRPSTPTLVIAWGDEGNGERADGVLCGGWGSERVEK